MERLHLVRSEKNSGGAGTPRNIGLKYSYGQYIFLMDADDTIVDTALDELYKTAEEFNADIVHCEKNFQAPDETATTDKKLLKEVFQSRNDDAFVKAPTVISNDVADKTKLFLEGKFWWAPWSHLIKRDLLMEQDIKFSNLSIADDLIFSFFIMIAAKKIVYVPSIVYVWRVLKNSNSREISDPAKTVHRRAGDIFKGITLLDEFTGKFEFFKSHPDYKQSIFEFFTLNQLNYLYHIYAQIPAWQLDGLIRRELAEVKDKTALTAFLFARMNLLNVQLLRAQNLLRQQPKEVQDFQRQNEIIQRQQAQIQELQQQLRNVHDVFR